MKLLTLKQRLGLIIQDHRKSQNISQIELSEKLNYSQSMISRMEKGYDAISIESFVQTIEHLGLFCDISEELSTKIDQLLQSFHYGIIELDNESVRETLNEFNQLMPNVVYYYDYLVIEAAAFYFEGNDRECIALLQTIKGHEKMCDPRTRESYRFMRRLYIYNKLIKATLKEQEELKAEYNKGLEYYLSGIGEYYSFSYSEALRDFLQSITYYQREHNLRRVAHAECYINKILMKDNDYVNIKVRTQALLKKNIAFIPRDYATLTFQLAYSHYYLKEYDQAYTLFQKLEGQAFEYDYLIPYMLQKCLLNVVEYHTLALPSEEINSETILYHLLLSYNNETKDASFYKLIEQNILPLLPMRLEIKEYQIYTLDLMEYYFQEKKYTKYKKLIEKLNTYYHIL